MAHITRHNPAAVHASSGGYSMGLKLDQHRRLLFVNGQVAERADGSVREGFEAQCEQAWHNMAAQRSILDGLGESELPHDGPKQPPIMRYGKNALPRPPYDHRSVIG